MSADVVLRSSGLVKVYRTGEVEAVALRQILLEIVRGDIVSPHPSAVTDESHVAQRRT